MRTREVALLVAGSLGEARRLVNKMLPPDTKVVVYGNSRAQSWIFLARQYGALWHAVLVAEEGGNDRARSYKRK